MLINFLKKKKKCSFTFLHLNCIFEFAVCVNSRSSVLEKVVLTLRSLLSSIWLI